jgi:hypothetical protein
MNKNIINIIEDLKIRDNQIEDKSIDDIIKDLSMLISILPKYYSDSLDRKNLWNRISTGIIKASEEIYDLNIYQWFNIIINHIKVDYGEIINSYKIKNIVDKLQNMTNELKQELINICREQTYIILVEAKILWEANKKGNNNE